MGREGGGREAPYSHCGPTIPPPPPHKYRANMAVKKMRPVQQLFYFLLLATAVVATATATATADEVITVVVVDFPNS